MHTPVKSLIVKGIREEELKERFIRSSAPGGQNVNKTSTCVYLKHLPTGLEVKCQIERSQAQNRYLALCEVAKEQNSLARDVACTVSVICGISCLIGALQNGKSRYDDLCFACSWA